MILYEFEGKELLSKVGISVPRSQLLESPESTTGLKFPLVLKAQVLSGKRADAGGIIVCNKISNFKFQISNLFKKTINGERVDKVLVEEMVEHDGPEYYLSISYGTVSRGPVLTVSSSGGTGIEERNSQVYPINPITLQCTIVHQTVPNDLLEKLVHLFFEEDMLLLEINPLVKVGGEWIALDAKIKLDDDAKTRHPEWKYPPHGVPGHTPTKSEVAAKKIDEGDYRGTAGSTYFDLPGDIGILASGGGISLTALDALIAAGGKPANFTEYSGNPTREKVIKLTKIVLGKPDLHGLWVIGTVAANFTDIYETLMGIVDGLREFKSGSGGHIGFPIVIRRGGPRDEEAFAELTKIREFDFHLEGPETSVVGSAHVMAKLAKKYASTT